MAEIKNRIPISTPHIMQGDLSDLEKAIIMFESALKECTKAQEYYMIGITIKLNNETRAKIQALYKKAGWTDVLCTDLSDSEIELTGLYLK